jgi:hypothetical protein
MPNPPQTTEYSSRLFRAGLYGSHHRARFAWLGRKLQSLGLQHASILELGCFDGKSIEYVPMDIQRYVGFDAGWESGVRDGVPHGIDAARQRYANDERFTFHLSRDPRDVREVPGTVDVGICLETLEHIEPDLVDAYLAALAAKVTNTLLITVPNEKGLALLVKSAGRLALGVKGSGSGYTAPEFLNALLGRMHRVPRNQHKGFDYAQLVRSLRAHFSSVTVEGVRCRWLPKPLQLTIGIVAKP